MQRFTIFFPSFSGRELIKDALSMWASAPLPCSATCLDQNITGALSQPWHDLYFEECSYTGPLLCVGLSRVHCVG